MNRNIKLLDGAIGTTLWNKAEQRGVKKVPVWIYNIEQPDMVAELYREYIAAGSDIICTNTFGANALDVKRTSYTVEQAVRAGVAIAREAVKGTPVKVALDAGPLSQLMEPYGDLEEDEVDEIYAEIFAAGAAEGADYIFLETFMDVEMMRVAATAAKRTGLPVFCSMTFEKVGKTMMGNSVAQIVETLTEVGVDAIGMNCSVGPAQALSIVKEFAEKTDLPIFFKPNAGLPEMGADGQVVHAYTAEMFVKEVMPALEYASFVGGCCGSNVDYIRGLRAALDA